MGGGEVVKWGINPDDETNWSIASTNTNPWGEQITIPSFPKVLCLEYGQVFKS